ncbi:MAG TPA: hypothetical protein VGX28_14725 [Frankiaceae bacterium]|jgi:hypothetical protein|nr:hypothetical protein [Frankiaceae bacterium]
MPRTFLAATAAAALAVSVPAAAGALPYARERTATVEYVTAGGVAGVISGDSNMNGTHYGSARVFTRKGESRFSITVTDANGLPVAFEVAQDVNGDGRSDEETYGEFCGTTGPTPLRIAKQRADIVVFILAGQCGTGASVPTKGTVVARVS